MLQITDRDKKLKLMEKKPTPAPRIRKTDEDGPTLQELCKEAGRNYWTVVRRMKPRSKGGQGMTLEEALSTPVKSNHECARKGASKSSWRKGIPGLGES